MRGYGVAALHDATGEMAALHRGGRRSRVLREWGFQQLTAVTRPHRGHRLGLLVKTAMLELLAEAEPQLEYIATGNAAANEHMIAVNEQLGYEVVEPGWQWYEMPVADILGQRRVALPTTWHGRIAAAEANAGEMRLGGTRGRELAGRSHGQS